MLVATFHPELTDDTTVHEYFVKMAERSGGWGSGCKASDENNAGLKPGATHPRGDCGK